jgi:DNA-binding beta-propeller fold protein YncE
MALLAVGGLLGACLMWPTLFLGRQGSSLPTIDITTAAYTSKSFSISGQETGATCIRFREDGAKFYIVGAVGRDISQYSCSTPWDVSTASFDSKSYSFNSLSGITESIFFKPGGTTYYLLSSSNDAVYQMSCSASDISTSSYSGLSASIGSQETEAHGLAFSPNGENMYVIGQRNSTGDIYQYTLSTPWNVATASYASKTLSVNAQSAFPTDIAFTADGRQMFVTDQGDSIFQYSLSTAWDISTATYDSKSFSVTSQDQTPEGLFIRPDHSGFYVVGQQFDNVYQYSLG